MATTVNTTVTELPESRVRVEAEIGTDELDRRVTQAARQLARNLRRPRSRRNGPRCPSGQSRKRRRSGLSRKNGRSRKSGRSSRRSR